MEGATSLSTRLTKWGLTQTKTTSLFFTDSELLHVTLIPSFYWKYRNVITLHVCCHSNLLNMSYCLTLIEHWACSSKFWCLCCIYFRYHSLSLPQTWLHFRHGALLLPTCLPWLKSLQALRRTISNAVLSLQLGQTKHVGKENVSAAHQIVWAAKGHSPIRTPINRGHPL